MSVIAFESERILVTDEQLREWVVPPDMRNEEGAPIQVRGPCPRCGHNTTADVVVSVLAVAQSVEGVTLPPMQERVTRVVECNCGISHPQSVTPGAAKPVSPDAKGAGEPAPTVKSCGRWWLVTILLDPELEHPVRTGDESLLEAAQAVQAAVADEETRIRGSAEKWIAGVSALLSLFGLSGVVVAKDGFADLPAVAAWIAGGLVGVALLAATFAVYLSYRAAYGWPVPVDIRNDEKLREWFAARRMRVVTAASNLRNGVQLACGALAALSMAVAVVWFWPGEDPEPVVQVTLTDDSSVCGELLASKEAGTIRVRSSAGVLTVIEASRIQRVAAKQKCPT
jgi:hypothetical protein